MKRFLGGHRKTGRETTKPLREKIPLTPSMEGLPPELLEALVKAFGVVAPPSTEAMEADVDIDLVEKLWRSHAINFNNAVDAVETAVCGPRDSVDERIMRSQSFARVMAAHISLLGASMDVPASYNEFARIHALRLVAQYEKEKAKEKKEKG